MKNIYFLLIFFIVTTITAYADAGYAKGIATDTIFANITPTQANDTILAHANDPWFVILDVRTLSEYTVKHLSEGVQIDFYEATFAATLATLNRSKTYVLHCASGGRSGQVYVMMQNLHFSKVYNMTGGITAWQNAGFSVTTDEASATGILCDTIASFDSIPQSQTDSIQFTITNAANSVLSFDSISELSGTEFSTNFNINDTILGARDYSFFLYYTPSDTTTDSTIFSIYSNAGIMNFYINGNAYAPTTSIKNSQDALALFNNTKNHTIQFQLKIPEITEIVIYDIQGKIIYQQQQVKPSTVIDYSNWQSSIYILCIKNTNGSKTYKLPLIH